MPSLSMLRVAGPVVLAVVTAAASVPRGTRLLEIGRGPSLSGLVGFDGKKIDMYPLGTYGMRPCKKCGGAGSSMHSRDDLLMRDDAELNKMKNALEPEVEGLVADFKSLSAKDKAEIGKLEKRLSDAKAAYKKLEKDAVDRSTLFALSKAKAADGLGGMLNGTEENNAEIAEIHASMDELRHKLNPYVQGLVSGKGWPKSCKCPKAKALLQRLQATLHLASVDLDSVEAPHRESLLRRSTKELKPADLEKYKIVREVMQLEETRAKLKSATTRETSLFSEKMRILLAYIEALKTKANLKKSTERKVEDSESDLEKHLKSQEAAATAYLKTSEAQVERFRKEEKTAKKEFADFMAALKKCNCV